MFTLSQALATREQTVTEGMSLIVALAIAEAFYKFHSFTVECAAFLLTWYGLSAAVSYLRERTR